MKKGFTLVELLAVIVILAVIALIATPMIMGIIDKARKGALKETVHAYIESIQNTVAIKSMETSESYRGTTCRLSKEMMICDNESDFEIKIKGEKLDTLNIVFSNNEIIEKAQFKKGNYCGNYKKNSEIKFVECNLYKIDALDLSYTPSNKNWKVSNVEEALNELRKGIIR